MKRGIFYSILAILGMVKFSVLLAEELSWTMLDGPYGGGNITCLLQDKDGTIWAGSNQYGLFKSNDLAQTWQQLPIPELFGKTITCMDAREDFLYIGTYGPTFRFDMKAFTGYWIWLSNARKIKATSSEHFYALTNIPEDRDKIYYVDPAGDTIEIGPPEGFSYVADIDVTVDDILYAMVPDRLFRSSDHGDSWEDLSPPAGFRLAGLYTALDVNEDGDIFILNGGWPGSRDDETPRMGFFYHYSPFMGWTTKQTIPATFWDVTSLQVNGDIIAASPTGYSLDHGATWNAVQFDDSAPYATYRALMYIPEGKFMASTAFNVFFSADLGSSWQTRNHDLYFGKQLDIHPNGDLYVSNGWSIVNPATESIINRSQDHGQTWQQVNMVPLRSDPLYAVKSGKNIFAWAYNSIDIYYCSIDEGQTWNYSYPNPVDMKVLCRNSKGYMYFITSVNEVYSELYRSVDGGVTIQRFLPDLSSANARFFDLKIGMDDALYLIIGMQRSGCTTCTQYDAKLYASHDDGQNWASFDIPFFTPRPFGWTERASLSINPAGDLFCMLSGKWSATFDLDDPFSQVISSKDGGLTWKLIYMTGDHDTPLFIHSSGLLFGYMFDNNESFWTPNAERKLNWSADNGLSWTAQNWQASIKEFQEHSDGTLFAVTPYQGIYAAKPQILFTPKLVHPTSLTSQKTYGVCWIDYNNDGFEDLFFANQGPNELYQNMGSGTFAKILTGAIVADDEPSRAATWGDYDNDGDADLFVANEGVANSLYCNNGDGSFSKITGSLLAAYNGASRGCAWGDYDNDGWLDLIVANRNERNLLYHNLGNGDFLPLSYPFGNDIGDSFGCSWCDYDLDGDLDLFVANYGENYLYRQTSKGNFSRVSAEAFSHEELYSFGGSWGDFDGDGYPDLFVTNADGPNTLYHNQGDGRFITAQSAGITPDEGISKGSGWADYDNDGDLDLFIVTNGSKFFYRNNSDGTFSTVPHDDFVYYPSNTLSLAWGDGDNDGDQDLLVTSYNQQTVLYRNSNPAAHWVKVRCIGTLSNRSGIGARVSIKANHNGQTKWQTREINSQSGFAGQSSLIVHFGLGNAEMIDSLRVVWPSGRVQVITALMANECVDIVESAVVPVELASFSALFNEDRVVLQWRTLTEQINYGFEIQRKGDEDIWLKIGFIPGHGTTADPNTYHFNDTTLPGQGKYKYRLKIIDQDGSFEYSEAIAVSYNLPLQFELSQNFPNPFNTSTLIRYALSNDGPVKLEVYDLLGRRVDILTDGTQKAGYYEYVFQNKGLSSGIYIYRLTANGFCQQKKMIIIN